MGEIQEALLHTGGYEIILSHLHNSCTPGREMTQENETICKWATYCLCCCLGDVLEPLEYVKKEIKNAVYEGQKRTRENGRLRDFFLFDNFRVELLGTALAGDIALGGDLGPKLGALSGQVVGQNQSLPETHGC